VVQRSKEFQWVGVAGVIVDAQNDGPS